MNTNVLFNILSTISHKCNSCFFVPFIFLLFQCKFMCDVNFNSVLFSISIFVGGCWPMNSIRHFNKSFNLIQHHQLCSVLRATFWYWNDFLFSLILLFIYCADWTFCILQKFAKSMAKYSCHLLVFKLPMAAKKRQKKIEMEKKVPVKLKLTHNDNRYSVLWQK